MLVQVAAELQPPLSVSHSMISTSSHFTTIKVVQLKSIISIVLRKTTRHYAMASDRVSIRKCVMFHVFLTFNTVTSILQYSMERRV